MRINYPYLGIGISVILLGSTGIYLLSKKEKKNASSPSKSKKGTKGQKQPIESKNSRDILHEPNWSQPFNQEFAFDVKNYLSPKPIKSLSTSQGLRLAKEIKEADGFFPNAEIVKNIFQKKLRDKVAVSNLSKVFYDEYNRKDLWQFVGKIIGQSNMESEINSYVKRLPNYRIA